MGSTSLTTCGENCGVLPGAIVSEARYLPYGQERWSGGEMPTDFGFTSQRNERGFGLYDYNARYYSAVLGRFVSPDSIVPEPGSSGGFNRYRYTRNNPLKFTDPSGHCALCLIGIAALIITVATACDSTPPPPPPDTKLQEIKNLMSSDGQRAIDLTIETFEIKVNQDALWGEGELRKPIYSPPQVNDLTKNVDVGGQPLGVTREATLSGVEQGKALVYIGDGAMEGSPNMLASIIGHELVHADQIARGDTELGQNERELEAYEWELKNAERLGLSDDELKEIQDKYNYYNEKIKSGE